MKKKKIIIVLGTRPEAIKMAPLIHDLWKESEKFEIFVCVTAQHREMLDQVLQVFEITPDIDMNLMKSNQNLIVLTSSILTKMRKIFLKIKPDVVLVHGDTTTTLATAMASFYLGIPVGHVEAGMRTHNLHAPFPEEFNRQIVSKVAKWNFAPTISNRDNLLAENVIYNSITVTGNTVIDALYWVLARINSDIKRRDKLEHELNCFLPFEWKKEKYILITVHRRENLGKPLLEICSAIKILANRYPAVNFVCPMHLNPNVQKPIKDILANQNNVYLIDPLGYETFIYLLNYSYMVLTDSGGIQEEAPSLGKPVLVMRDETERSEAVKAGTVKMVGTCQLQIIKSVSFLLENEAQYKKMSKSHNPYGDGKACQRILDVLRKI